MGAMGAIEAAATRIVASADLAQTTEVAAISETAEHTATTDLAAGGKIPVGKATILRMMTEERSKSRQIWIAALSAVVLLAVIGGVALYRHSQSVAGQLAKQLAEQQAIAAANKREAEENLSKQMGIPPAEIKRLGKFDGLHPQSMAALRSYDQSADLSEDG